MIITQTGSLLDAQGILVHGCNCQGVMDSGVALAVKKKWPFVFDQYKDIQEKEGLYLGEAYRVRVSDAVVVVNGMTQEFYGTGCRHVNYEAVAKVFECVNRLSDSLKIKTVNFPKIGAGLGGGNWNIIATIIDETLDDHIEKILWEL